MFAILACLVGVSGAWASCNEGDQCSVDAKVGGEGGWALLQRKQHIVKESITTEDESAPSFLHKYVDGGDWTAVNCPHGYLATGGGCKAKTDPFAYRHSGPVGNPPHGWSCGGNGTSKRAEVHCTKAFSTTVVSQSGGDWVHVYCPSGYKVIGGGCDAKASPFKFQASTPWGETGWRCGGFGGPKTAWAVCTNAAIPYYQRHKEGGDWVDVSCDAGHHALGGGCDAFTSPFLILENKGSWGTTWKCGGHGGKKKATVICTSPTPAPTPLPSPAPTQQPTLEPTAEPTAKPTLEPKEAPTSQPTSKKCSECVLGFSGLENSADTRDEFIYAPETKFRFKNACINGPNVDLLLTLRNWNTKPKKNKAVGQYFEVNVKDGSMPQIQFEFVKPGTASSFVVMDKVYLSVLDMDMLSGMAQTQYIGISANAYSKEWHGTNILKAVQSSNEYYDEEFTGTADGNAADNPTADSAIGAEAVKNSVSLLFENTPTFQFYLGVKSQKGMDSGRSFFLFGRTPLVNDTLSCD